MARILAQRKLRMMRIHGRRIDSINIRLWNLALSTLFFLAMMVAVDPESICGIICVSRRLVIITLVSMCVTFFARIAYIRALGIGKASITQAITSMTILLGIPVTLLMGILAPGSVVPVAASPWVLIVKLIGTVMVSLGIITLALSEVRAYILIRAPKGHWRHILRQLSKIKGVTLVSALAGKYDFIAKVKLRALGKGYRLVVRGLERLKGITDFVWLSILYEWEEV